MWYVKYVYVCVYINTHICTHTGILFSHEKEGNLAICNNTDGPSGHYSKWNKPKTAKYCMVSFICGIQKQKIQTHTRGLRLAGKGWYWLNSTEFTF